VDGSNLIFIVMPIVIAVCLGSMISLPYIGGREQARASAARRQHSPDAIGAPAPPAVPVAGAPLSASPIAATLATSPESPAEESGTT
jgi:hypothetical protein